MTDNPFFEALKGSVGRAKGAFDAADADIHSAVSEVNAAIQEFANGRLAVGLDMREDTIKGRLYDLVLSEEGIGDSSRPSAFFVPQTGYPIQAGTTDIADNFLATGVLRDASQLHDFFVRMMSDPASPLTVTIAFRLRRKLEK